MAQITLRDYLQKTEDAISSSRVDDALTRCQLMLSYFPEALEVQRLLGEVYLAQERLEDAQHVFDWVLTNDPENVLAYCNRADVSERMSEYDIALDCYQQAYELSRGNGQIRQEFNRLSEKVGQKGFMFSRAGLARIYMRGDLLSQAVQEWDSVLTVTPDRLDARTGQLETYWRVGQLENVVQLAEQILQDVPGCLKALLLQAFVIFQQDSQRSQELLLRSQALDPDFVMAQELFADTLARQPGDPFLQLIKQPPATFNPAAPEIKENAASVPQPNSFVPASGTVNTFGNSSLANALANWGSDTSWNGDTTLIKPQPDTMSALSQNDFNGSSHSGISLPISNGVASPTWNAPGQEDSIPASQDTSIENGEHAPEPWELLQNALHQFGTNGNANSYEDNLPLWENLPGSPTLDQANPDESQSSPWLLPEQQENSSLSGIGADIWGAPTGEMSFIVKENVPTPPTWLNMLSQPSRTSTGSDLSTFAFEPQPTNNQPSAELLAEQPELAQANVLSADDHDLSAFQSIPLTNPVENVALHSVEMPPVETGKGEEDRPIEDGDEESFFGPAWLKSLGATALSDDETSASALEAKMQDVEQQEYAQPDYTNTENHTTSAPQSSHAPESTTNLYESWLQEQVGLNNSPANDEHTSWSTASTGEAQPAQYTQFENWPSGGESRASNIQSSLFPTERPIGQSGQPETAQGNVEQNLVTTLEELEQSLRSKGFIPLEPNSLAIVASKTQENPNSSEEIAVQEEHEAQNFQQPESSQEVQHAQNEQDIASVQNMQEEFGSSSLSSALAQLGSFTSSTFESMGQSEEPSWLQELKNTPIAPVGADTSLEPVVQADILTPQAEPGQQYQQLQDVFSHFQPTPTLLSQPGEQELSTSNPPNTPSVRIETDTANSNDLKKPMAKELQETVKVSALRKHPLLDGGLETTMKRPAVRLQPMQHHASPVQAPGGARIVSRSQSGERIEKAVSRVAKTTNENQSLSYHDRLLKGYQHQLVGDYDEAMQEYRLIIRNATDLLGEVVSNVRALLKLAPNYAPGYRVLGDAYMRQGEYLQAMEAYNKALSMTKKVK